MFPNILLCSSSIERKKKKKKVELQSAWRDLETGIQESHYLDSTNSIPFYANQFAKPPITTTTTANLSISSDYSTFSRGGLKAKKKGSERAIMSKVSNFSDLIHRVTASCLLHPLAADHRHFSGDPFSIAGDKQEEEVYEYETDEHDHQNNDDDEEEEEETEQVQQQWKRSKKKSNTSSNGGGDAETMAAVFEAVAAMKKAYARLQEAHCPWDADLMRSADAAVVAEIRRIGVLRERFRRSFNGGGAGGAMTAATVRELVAPYEAAVDELRREVKAREAEVESLKEKLKSFVVNGGSGGGGGGGKKGRSFSRKKVSCIHAQVAVNPSSELFEATMGRVNEGLKSFTSLLLSLMRSAQWDIAAAVRSIEAASAGATAQQPDRSAVIVSSQHAKYAMESYVARKLFQGFDHETFYMDGSLSSLLNPDHFRRECFAQFRDMKAMDPAELLGILPTCHFGRFCSKKYLSLVHPKMEESLFGHLDQHRLAAAGSHPRTDFYGHFLGLAKAVWLLHLLAFSLDPVPAQFEAARGAQFHPHFMESVLRPAPAAQGSGLVVGLPVSPGFKMWDGSVIKARVYLVSSRS